MWDYMLSLLYVINVEMRGGHGKSSRINHY